MFSLLREGELLGEIEGMGVPVLEYRTGTSLLSPATARGLWAAAARLRRDRVDILSPMLGIATLFGPFVGRAAGVPVIVNHQRNLGARLNGPFENRIYGYVNRALVDAVFVNNSAAARELATRYAVPASKIVHVGMGIDLCRFSDVPWDPRTSRGLGLEGHPVVGAVGKLSAVKGHEYFLEAAARIAQKRDDVRFLVVGDGPRREELQDLSRKLGIHDRTVFAGARNDVPALLGLMSVFVLPSVSEGAPNIVMEAMAAGVPIVATDVGGVADVVGDPGAAKLVPARDPEAIAGAVGDLLSDPAAARAMGRTAARVARERHDIDVVVRRMEDAFLRLLGKRAPGRIMPHRKGGEGIVGAVHGGIQ